MGNSKTNGKVISALLIGAAIGGVIGVFLASEKGDELRKIVIGKTGDLAESLKEKFNSILEEAKSGVAISKDKVKELATNTKVP